MGPIGLNLVPTARMDERGTIRASVSNADPYAHASIGFQPLETLYIQLRQSAEISSLRKEPDALHPGIDLKFRLSDEGRYQPEAVIGINSAYGHRRTASEYIALTKRIESFDITAGMGWGRLGTAGHIKNPLSRLSNHFDGTRDLSSSDPNSAGDWFTGRDAGFFGGIEYFTPLEGLTFKADYSADKYIAERQAIAGFNAPAPWSLSVNYAPVDYVSIGAGIVGTDTIMARLSFQGNAADWPGRGGDTGTPPALSPHRAGMFHPTKTRYDAAQADIDMFALKGGDIHASAQLAVSPNHPPARQVGRAIRYLANNAGTEIESLEIRTSSMGLRGPKIRVSRRDVESAAIRHKGSPEEIWQDAQIIADDEPHDRDATRSYPWEFFFTADQQVSLSEEDSGFLYRTSLIGDFREQWPLGFVTGTSLRLNVADNLERLSALRAPAATPIRSDVNDFTTPALTLDTAYIAWLKTLWPDLHMALTGGYLEEMFYGAGGEVLWRPFGKTFAIGAEAWAAVRRDPDTPFNLGVEPQKFSAAQINFFYEIPQTDITAFASAGRYLGSDIGGSIGVETTFDNGVSVRAHVTGTNAADPDVFGSTTHIFTGLQISLPLGNIPFVPDGSSARVRFEPFGRDAAQGIKKPLPLYDLTEPVSYRRLAHSWGEFLN